jgi:hypothetical protein
MADVKTWQERRDGTFMSERAARDAEATELRSVLQSHRSNEQALATALRGLHGWAIEMLDMAEFKAWPDADRADFMLKMRTAEDLLKNYPRKP